jgi:hypothetical protein
MCRCNVLHNSLSAWKGKNKLGYLGFEALLNASAGRKRRADIDADSYPVTKRPTSPRLYEMAKKRTSAAAPKDDLLNSSAAPSSTALEPSSTDRSSSSFPASLSPPVKINNASLSEVKTALDDAIRNVSPFTPAPLRRRH